MTGQPAEWDYLCHADDCENRVSVEPVPNQVYCGICGTEMVVFAIEEGR